MKKINTNLIFDARKCDVISLRTGQLPMSVVIAQKQEQQLVTAVDGGGVGESDRSERGSARSRAQWRGGTDRDSCHVRGGEDGYDSA